MYDDESISKYIDELDSRDKYKVSRMVIAKFIPSMKQLFRVMRKKGLFIDTRDKNTKNFIREAYKLKEKGFSAEERFIYFKLVEPINTITEIIKNQEQRIIKMEEKLNNRVYCNDKEFGYGNIVQRFSNNLMLVKFDKRELNTMCDSKLMVTVHDNIKRKIEFVH